MESWLPDHCVVLDPQTEASASQYMGHETRAERPVVGRCNYDITLSAKVNTSWSTEGMGAREVFNEIQWEHNNQSFSPSPNHYKFRNGWCGHVSGRAAVHGVVYSYAIFMFIKRELQSDSPCDFMCRLCQCYMGNLYKPVLSTDGVLNTYLWNKQLNDYFLAIDLSSVYITAGKLGELPGSSILWYHFNDPQSQGSVFSVK